MGGQRLRLHGGNYSMDVFHLGFRDLHVFNTWLSYGKKHSRYVYGNHHLVETIVIICKKIYLCFIGYNLCWHGNERLCSQFNRFFRLGVKEVGDMVEAPSQRILEFVEARQLLRIPPNYGFIWSQLQNIPLMRGPLPLHTEEQPWTDWCLKGQTSLLQVTTNLLYHCSVDSVGWLSSKGKEE